MDLTSIVQNSIFVFVTGALGGLCGALLKARADVYTSEAKRRQDMVTHFIQQIEELAPSYYLMSNHASLLSWQLNSYLAMKQELQMTLQAPGDSPYKYLAENADITAKEALFEAGKLYRVITDRFWNQGGAYLVPDLWANEALDGLHNQIMAVLIFDSGVLLKYIDSKTERQEFLDKLDLAEKGDEHYADLREQYVRYKDWVLKQDKELKCLAANALAYSDLFSLEMKRLYKDVWGKTADDPLKAPEVTGLSTALPAGTKKLIQSAAEENDRLEKRQADAQNTDANVAMSDAFLSVGWSYYDAGQFNRAIEEYLTAIAKNPGSAVAHNHLGNAYTGNRDYKNAAEAYTKASELDPSNPIFAHNHGRMLSRSEQYEAATVLFDRAIKLGMAPDRANDQRQALRYNDLGLAFDALQRRDDAIGAYGKAIVLQPLVPVLYENLAQSYEGKYDGAPQERADAEALEAAMGAYSMAASLNVGDDVARCERNVAAIHRKVKRWTSAADTYRKALEHCVGDEAKIETHYQMGEMYREQADWSRAAHEYEQALELGGNKNSLFAWRLMDALQQSGNPIPADLARKSIAACLAAIQAEPAEVPHHQRLANVYYSCDDYHGFLDEWDKIVRLAAESRPSKEKMASYYDQLGFAYRRLKIWDMALLYYRKAIELDEKNLDYHRNRGLARQSLGLYDAAREDLELVKEGRPDDYDVMLSLAEVTAYGSKPDLESAMNLCRAAAEKSPNSPKAFNLIGNLLVVQGSFVEGAKAYWKACGLTTNAQEIEELLRKGVDAYDRAISAGDNRIEVQYGRAKMLYRLGDYPKAKEGYDAALKLAEGQPLNLISIHDALAEVSYVGEDYDGARSAWEKALALADQLSAQDRSGLKDAPLGRINLEQITNNLGTAYDALGTKAKDEALKIKALDCYQEAALRSPDTFVAHFNLANSLYQQKQFDKALSQYQEAFRLRPPAELDLRTLFRIGNCFFRLNRGDLAVDKWYEVTRGGIDLAEAHYNLGVLFWLNGQKEDAAKRWETALMASSSLWEAEYNLGVHSLDSGDSAQAMAHWKAIAGKPGFESLEETIQKVDKGEKPALEIKDIRDI